MLKSVLLALYYLIEFIQAQKYEKKPYFELLYPSPIDVNHSDCGALPFVQGFQSNDSLLEFLWNYLYAVFFFQQKPIAANTLIVYREHFDC